MRIFNQNYLASVMQLNNNNTDRTAMTNPNKLSFSNQLTQDVVSFTSRVNRLDNIAFKSNAEPYYKNKMTIDDLPDNMHGERVLLRVDHNVKMKNGEITNDFRMRETLKTISKLQDKNARVIVVTHLGRPQEYLDEGKSLDTLKTDPLAKHLQVLLNEDKSRPETTVIKVDECIGKDVVDRSKNLQSNEILYLENVRFDPREEKGDEEFAMQLAEVADHYVNDAFGAAHRNHGSTSTVSKYIKGNKVAGYLMEREYTELGSNLLDPPRPFVEITSGSKAGTKINGMKQRMATMQPGDCIVLGGAVPFTFLKAQGYNIGSSLIEKNKDGTIKQENLDKALDVIDEAEKKGINLIIPEDVVVLRKECWGTNKADLVEGRDYKTVPAKQIEDGWMGVDIGPKTVAKIKEAISNCKTTLWNGPLGVYEDGHIEASREIALSIAEVKNREDGRTIVGGGDTVDLIKVLNKDGVSDKSYSFVSSGGGASSEFLEGKPLPGITCLQEREKAA